MNRIFAASALAATLTLVAACDGPNEKAGREADRAAAAAVGQNISGEGPQERLGEAQDKLEDAAADARDAAADAIERQADEVRAKTEVAADTLDERARAVRDGTAAP